MSLLEQFVAAGQQLGLTGADIAPMLAKRPEFADCHPLPEKPLQTTPTRPTEEVARTAIEAWLAREAPGYPDYSLSEDGDDGWSFWIAEQDTTSYLHHDMRIEWYGTGWPECYHYDGDSGMWSVIHPPV